MQVSYELAKKLKDAGFPQDCGRHHGTKKVIRRRTSVKFPTKEGIKRFRASVGIDVGKQDPCAIPALSELIEACGEEVFLTNCIGFADRYKSKQGWIASKSYGVEKPEDLGEGKTPEEAVAKLWLALNDKE